MKSKVFQFDIQAWIMDTNERGEVVGIRQSHVRPVYESNFATTLDELSLQIIIEQETPHGELRAGNPNPPRGRGGVRK